MLPKAAINMSHFKLSHLAARSSQHFQHLVHAFNGAHTAAGNTATAAGSGGYAGTGGAKWSAGSRQWGYSGPGRLVSQGSTSGDPQNTRNDDDEEQPFNRSRRPNRLRSSSTDLSRRPGSLTALYSRPRLSPALETDPASAQRTMQKWARLAFLNSQAQAQSASPPPPTGDLPLPSSQESSPGPSRSRRPAASRRVTPETEASEPAATSGSSQSDASPSTVPFPGHRTRGRSSSHSGPRSSSSNRDASQGRPRRAISESSTTHDRFMGFELDSAQKAAVDAIRAVRGPSADAARHVAAVHAYLADPAVHSDVGHIECIYNLSRIDVCFRDFAGKDVETLLKLYEHVAQTVRPDTPRRIAALNNATQRTIFGLALSELRQNEFETAERIFDLRRRLAAESGLDGGPAWAFLESVPVSLSESDAILKQWSKSFSEPFIRSPRPSGASFDRAMDLVRTLEARGGAPTPVTTYSLMLRVAAILGRHGDALVLFGILRTAAQNNPERVRVTPAAYAALITACAEARDVESAQAAYEIFVQEGGMTAQPVDRKEDVSSLALVGARTGARIIEISDPTSDEGQPRLSLLLRSIGNEFGENEPLLVVNAMITARLVVGDLSGATSLIEELKSQGPTSNLTINASVLGFVKAGNLASAVQSIGSSLQRPDSQTPADLSLLALPTYDRLVEALVAKDDVVNALALIKVIAKAGPQAVRRYHHQAWAAISPLVDLVIKSVNSDPSSSESRERLDVIGDSMKNIIVLHSGYKLSHFGLARRTIQTLAAHGAVDDAAILFYKTIEVFVAAAREPDSRTLVDTLPLVADKLLDSFVGPSHAGRSVELPLHTAVRLAVAAVRLLPTEYQSLRLLNSVIEAYHQERSNNPPAEWSARLANLDWPAFLDVVGATMLARIPVPIDLILSDFEETGVTLPTYNSQIFEIGLGRALQGNEQQVIAALRLIRGLPATTEPSTVSEVESDLASVAGELRTQPSQSPSPPPTPVSSIAVSESSEPHLRLKSLASNDRTRAGHVFARNTSDAIRLFERVERHIRNGFIPPPSDLAEVLQTLGRFASGGRLPTVYQWAQLAMAESARAGASHEQLRSEWVEIENGMMMGLAHAGEIEAASGHRQNLLEHECVPSADAYGALITNARETTDDATVAEALYDEARRVGVVFNTFLYNTVISKLSRARRGSRALDIFAEMEAERIPPNSVTYGALINACCRMGDAAAAESYFERMVNQPGFRPRTPPYNTIIQFFAQSMPDREKALEYFGRMLDAQVPPSSHTYKLLLDIYGSMDPVDPTSMEDVFAQLESDRKVELSGTHWASVITSWGCVQKNVDKAVEVFESIRTHPSSRGSSPPLPDALVYQALLNACLANHRIDLCSHYIDTMPPSMKRTAYVVNSIIKHHQMSGRIEDARQAFESLEDPPSGVAARNNHTFERRPYRGPSDERVFREPSTYEAILRAERAHGGEGVEDRIANLLTRAQHRNFPEAVMNRLRAAVAEGASDSVTPTSHS